MPLIHVLNKAVAELIAAGEVVERPASVVKELVENCIDAGADDVTVEIKGGGVGYIRVTDNGCGIAPDDMPLAFLRHATSKVLTQEDLCEIATLGFRGEALASVAAVAKVEIRSRLRGFGEGTSICAEGGVIGYSKPDGHPEGTTVTVRDLFYNTPARMKFLKRDAAEGNAVAQVLDRIALSRPEIAIRFIRDGRQTLRTSGNGDLGAVIAAVYGRDAAQNLLDVDYCFERKIRVTGCVGAPSSARPTRSCQCFFINNRYIRSAACTAALEEAFKGKLMTGRYPVGVLNIEIPFGEVDVNVHPAKTEVRFSEERPVFSAIYYAVKSALEADGATANQNTRLHAEQVRHESTLFSKEGNAVTATPAVTDISTLSFCAPVAVAAAPGAGAIAAVAAPPAPPVPTAMFERFRDEIGSTIDTTPGEHSPPLHATPNRLIGELFGTYILLESGGELLLVDKHAAHEGVLYRRIRSETKLGHRQVLLSPLPLTLPREEYTALVENIAALEELGFLAEDFGDGTLLIRETPVLLHREDAAAMLCEVAGKLIGERAGDLAPAAFDALLHSVACKSAIRAGDKTGPEELREIVKMLEENPQISHCAHGRPIVVRIPKGKIEKMFGRLGSSL